MIDSMSSRHSKVLQTRMDFRYPKEIQSDGSNQDFQKTLQSLSRELTRKKYDPQYIARREQISSHNSHLHLALMVDGNKCRCADTLNRIAEKHWANTLGMPGESETEQLSPGTPESRRYESEDDSAALVSGQGR